jgi:hypothetical protein
MVHYASVASPSPNHLLDLNEHIIAAPAVLWRGLGSLALVITNRYNRPSKTEAFFGGQYDSWDRDWLDTGSDGLSRLLLRVREKKGVAGPSSLLVHGQNMEDGLYPYTYYVFQVPQDTQDEDGALAVFRGTRPNELPDASLLAAQREFQIETGLSRANSDDLEQLYLWLAAAPLVMPRPEAE